jgi:hypothetical protein
MNSNEEKLLSGLRALAASETGGPPPGLEAALLKHLSMQMKRRRVIAWPLVVEVLAAAAIVVIAIYSRPAASAPGEFVTVPYSAPIGPYERAELVRVNVPVVALAQWGLSVPAVDPGRRVNADVVIGEDGLARAVRLVGNP